MAGRYSQRGFAVVGDGYGRRYIEVDGEGDPVPAGAAPRMVSPAALQRLGMQQLAQEAAPVSPDWRARRLAAGTYAADEGMVPMAMTADINGGIFVAGGPGVITFTALPQKNYRPERLLATLVPVGASVAASRAITSGIFVGTDLQQANIGRIDLGMFVPQAFGVRLAVTPGEPGVQITIPVSLTVSPLNADTFTVILQWLGRVIH